MHALSDDLSIFGRAIVHGEAISSLVDDDCPHYSVDTAIEIYRNNYHGNLHDALADAYPVINQLVGDDFFRFMARQFIAQYPSCNANLHYFGAELADFLTTFAPAQKLVYLADVAVLEWACHRAYFADDTAMLDINKLAQIPPGQYSDLIMCIHPACQVVRSPYPINAIWHAHQPGKGGDFHVDLNSGASIVLVSRIADVVQVNELEADYAAWLHEVQAGRTLGTATDSTLEQFPDFDLQAALLKLVGQNILIDFNLGVTS
jgi:hypothetical protein